MTVLYIIDYGTIGGATHSFVELVTAMKEFGVTPIVCTGKKNSFNLLLDSLHIQNISLGHKTVLEPFLFKGIKWPIRLFRIVCSFYLNEYRALKILKNSITFSDIDLIHTNSARNDIGCYINKKYNIPHIMHIREFSDLDFDCISFRPNYISFYNKYVTNYVAISEAVKLHWINKGIKREKIKTIYNGIHFEDITISPNEDKKSARIKLLIAGGVCKAKGQLLAIEALCMLPENVRNNITLYVAGWQNEKYVKQMKQIVAGKGYEKGVVFLGVVNDLHSQIGKFQIGLMCSRAEGFGRVTAEYMHGQLGVIASDSGANPELIENGVTGLMFKSGDARSLSDCILSFYHDRESLIRLSNAAQKKARAMYTQEKNARSIFELYEQILNKKG